MKMLCEMIWELWMLIICLKKNIYDIDLGVEFFLWLNFIFGILNVEVWYLLSWIEIFL